MKLSDLPDDLREKIVGRISQVHQMNRRLNDTNTTIQLFQSGRVVKVTLHRSSGNVTDMVRLSDEELAQLPIGPTRSPRTLRLRGSGLAEDRTWVIGG